MQKKELLAHWKDLSQPQSLKPTPVPYKHTGSTFDEDGIRITGSPAFIDSVLSRLYDLLAFEGVKTRLQVSYKQAQDKQGNLLDSYTCYIQVHQRGREAQAMNAWVSAIQGKTVIASAGY